MAGRAGHSTPYMESTVEQLPVSHKAWAWFEANKKQTLWGVGVLMVVGVIVAYYLYAQDAAEVAAGEALSSVAVPNLTGSRVDSADA